MNTTKPHVGLIFLNKLLLFSYTLRGKKYFTAPKEYEMSSIGPLRKPFEQITPGDSNDSTLNEMNSQKSTSESDPPEFDCSRLLACVYHEALGHLIRTHSVSEPFRL